MTSDLATFEVGEGPDLVFLPGFAFNHRLPTGPSLWFERAQVAQLARHHRVHWVTRRRNAPLGFRIEDFAADVAHHLTSRFGGSAAIPAVGFSTGGFVGLALARDHPDLLSHLVMVGAGSQLTDSARDSERRLIEAMRSGDPRAAWSEVADGVGSPGGWLERSTARLLGAIGPPLVTVDTQDAIATAQADLDFDAAASLGSIRIPTLLVVGSRDTSCDLGLARRTVAAIPGAHLSVIPRAGHLHAMLSVRANRTITQFLTAAPERPTWRAP